MNLNRLRLSGGIQLLDVSADARVRIAAVEAEDLRVQGRFAFLDLGRDVQLRGDLRIDLQAPGKVRLRNLILGGRVLAKLEPGMELEGNLLRCEHLRFSGSDGKDPADRPIPVRLQRLEVDRDLAARGPIDLAIDQAKIGTDLRVTDSLAALALDDVDITGSIDLSDARIHGPVRMSRSQVYKTLRAERARLGDLTIHASNCTGNMLFARAEIGGSLCIAQPGEWLAPGASPPGKPHPAAGALAGTVFRDQLDFTGARFLGPADFSHLVVEYEAKFEHAEFAGPVDFTGVQAGANLIFRNARFGADVHFNEAIISGLLDLRHARFARPPSFQGASFQQAVRLSAVRWPEPSAASSTSIQADLSHCICSGLLELIEPFGTDDRPLDASIPFRVNLTGATVERLAMDVQHMEHSLQWAEQTTAQNSPNDPPRTTPETRRRLLARLARTFETALLRDMRFDDADAFYRHSRRLEAATTSQRFRAWWLGKIWGHGTRPWRVLGWLIGFAGSMALLTAWAAWQPDRPRESWQDLVVAASHVLLGESPDFSRVPTLAWPLVFLIVFIGLILLNLFFAALARKLLR
ncbi:hypothetical protein BH23PLA1_BH23PLA1_33400 [soil metagenome]